MMLKYIKLENFKSYLGTHLFGPLHDGMSCIVGPNGSGKSNFIDAMLFVFGFRSSRLREQSLINLIHNSGDQCATSCRVTLTFQVPEGEVVVSRAISEGGYSYYYLNNRKATFQDIRGTMLSHGVDIKSGNFMMLQGEVEKLAMAGPETLLEFLQYVSGSHQFVETIKGLREQLEGLESSFFDIDKHYRKKLTLIRNLESKCLEAEEWIYWKRKLFGILETQFGHKKEQSEKSMMLLRAEIQRQSSELKMTETTSHEVLRVIRERIQGHRKTLGVLEGQSEEVGRSIKNLKLEIARKEKEWRSLESDYTDVYNKRSGAEQDLKIFQREGSKVGSLKRQMEDLENQLKAEFSQDQILRMKEGLGLYPEKEREEKRRGDLGVRNDEIETVLCKQRSLREQDHSEEISRLKGEVNQLRQRIAQVEGKLELAKASARFVEDQVELNRSKSQSVDLQRQAIKEGMKSGQLSGVWGQLKQKCYAEGIYAIPFNSVCSYLNFYVVDTVDNAEKLLKFVRRNNLGVVSLIVYGIINTPKLDLALSSEFVPPFPGVKRLFDFVKAVESKYLKVVYWAIRNTLVVKDLDEGIMVSFGQVRRRSVTLKGHIIYESGLMCSNRGVCHENLDSLSQKRSLILQQIKELSQALEQHRASLSRGEKELKAKQSFMEGVILLTLKQLEALEQQKQRNSSTIQQLQLRSTASDTAICQRFQVSTEDMARFRAISKSLEQIRERIRGTKSSEEVVEDFNLKIKRAREKEGKVWKCYQEAESALESLKLEKTRMEECRQKLGFEIIQCNAGINSLLFDIKVEQLRYSELNLSQDIKRIEAMKDSLKRQEQDLEKEQVKIKEERREVGRYENFQISHNFSPDNESLHEEDRRFGRASQLIREGIQADCSLIAYCKGKLNKIKGQSLEFQSIRLYHQQKISFDALEKEYNSKKSQIMKVKKQHQQNELQRKSMFFQGFDRIKKEFPAIFERISEGGEAEIAVNNGYNPFESGVFIRVKPLRKQWKKVNLLSGGEKTITSLALIFACNFAMKCPFYVIDEIDAALDINKVEVVAQFIKQNLDSQFIIISLREQMYRKASVMVPVYKINNCSIGFTLDIQRLREIVEDQIREQVRDKQSVGKDSQQR